MSRGRVARILQTAVKGDSRDDDRYADEMRIPGIPPPALATRVYVDVLSFTRTTRMVVPNLASPA